MEQLVRIRECYEDGTALVVHIRESACSGDCHKCSGCGAAKEAIELRAENPLDAPAGSLVRIRADSGPVLKAAAVLYVLPLALFFLGYYLGTLPGSYGALGGCLGFGLGVAAVVLYDRRVVRKANLGYTITAFAGDCPGKVMRKGEENHG